MKTWRSYIHLSKYHRWENPYLLRSVLLVYSNRCIPLCETHEILERATPYHKDDTTEYSVSMLRFGRMHNSSQPSFETLKNPCGAQDVRCYATEEQPSVGSNRHMGSSLCESFPMSEQVHLGGNGLFVQMDEALPVLRPTRRIQRRWFRKSHFLALNFQESCLVVKAHTSQDKTYRKCLSELRVKPPGCYSIPSLYQWLGGNI